MGDGQSSDSSSVNGANTAGGQAVTKAPPVAESTFRFMMALTVVNSLVLLLAMAARGSSVCGRRCSLGASTSTRWRRADGGLYRRAQTNASAGLDKTLQMGSVN